MADNYTFLPTMPRVKNFEIGNGFGHLAVGKIGRAHV